MLLDVEDGVQPDVGLERDGAERQQLDVLADLAADRLRLHVESEGQAPDLTPATIGLGRDAFGSDLHRQRRAVVDQHRSVAIHDPAARRLDLDLAHAVVVRLRQVMVAGQDLEVPEPEEDDREQRQRDAAEDRDPQRQLGRHDHAPVGRWQVHG